MFQRSYFRITILFLIVLLFTSYQFQDTPKYPVRPDGSPTKAGIKFYLESKESKLLLEYQDFIRDTLYDVYISIDNLSLYTNDPDILGFCISSLGSSEVIITNEEKYIAYEVDMLTKKQREEISEANNFVKGALFHELTHYYFNQVLRETSMDTSATIYADYISKFSILPKNFGAKFIEEGVCEYVVREMDEEIVFNDYIPKSLNELLSPNHQYEVMYKYSYHYVKGFLGLFGIKKGIKLLIQNPPPTYEEMLNPDKFFSRIIL